MHIIFGDAIKMIPDSFTVLELDTFRRVDGSQRSTAYCVVENVPLQDFPVLDAFVKAHHDLMQAYRDQNWEYCSSAIAGLMGRWNGELDSFYLDLAHRVVELEQHPPDAAWDGSRIKIQWPSDQQ
jgi:hypothetical protein